MWALRSFLDEQDEEYFDGGNGYHPLTILLWLMARQTRWSAGYDQDRMITELCDDADGAAELAATKATIAALPLLAPHTPMDQLLKALNRSFIVDWRIGQGRRARRAARRPALRPARRPALRHRGRQRCGWGCLLQYVFAKTGNPSADISSDENDYYGAHNEWVWSEARLLAGYQYRAIRMARSYQRWGRRARTDAKLLRNITTRIARVAAKLTPPLANPDDPHALINILADLAPTYEPGEEDQ